MCLSQVSSRIQVALSKQNKHLRGSNLRHPQQEVLSARGLLNLSQQRRSAVHITTGQFQAGQEHFADNETVNHAIILPRQLKALLSVLLGCLQIVPFVADMGQSKICFSGIRLWVVAKQGQDTAVSLSRKIKLVF